ncbi:MAG: valine--tRNA ligase [Deltaproteobacteria bacterium]|nr:MAG: valine--tRNA ligase [Deltaproteobacteria bacterium]
MSDRRTDLPKRFDPRPAESRWYGEWLTAGLFRASVDDSREAYSMVIPPPNVTGVLHLGHALNSSLQDTLARHERMLGKNVLWLPGTDHAGIATQVVVERELAQRGKTRHDLGREAFEAEVWEWKSHHGSRIIEQLQALGCSCDWSRERFTMDPGLSRAVREVFVRLYEQSLIYRDEFLVNWCPRCTTVLSDLESPYHTVEGQLFTIRYPLLDGPESIQVATTRPETMLGDTAVAVHPDDERYAALVGRTVRLPLLDREIPIVADPFVDPEFGSGAVKVTPGHDPNDFECGRRLQLPVINILNPDGTLNENAGPYAGLSVRAARERVVADLDAQNLLIRSERHTHEVPRCDRCDTLVEPLVSEQWFMRMEPLARPALAAVRDGRIAFHPRSWENTYFHWLENIRPWAISRQLWWGHRIPAWRCDDCREWTVSAEDPDACRACGSAALQQDGDVLETWFSSALWPFSTLGWPDDTPELRTFYPTSVLSTAGDIIFFWVARMIMMGLHFTGDVPFRHVYIHPLILDPEGKKMSKSRSNTIDPLEVMGEHGTDAFRWTLVALSAQGRNFRLGDDQIAGSRAFITKLWNAARFAQMNLADFDADAPARAGSLYDRWIRVRLDEALARAHRALDDFRFNDAADALYQFVWGEFCDWYIELAKQALQGDDADARRASQRTLVETLAGALAGLHPIMPFVTEEIFQALPGRDGRFLMQHGYPKQSPPLSNEEQREIDALIEVIRRVRQIRGELGLAPQARIRITFPTAAAQLVESHAGAIHSLTGASECRFADEEPPEQAAVTRVSGFSIAVELEDPSLLGDELRRLEKALRNLDKDLSFVAKKLDNPKFRERAKPAVVEAEVEKQKRLRDERASVEERLDRVRRIVGPGGGRP